MHFPRRLSQQSHELWTTHGRSRNCASALTDGISPHHDGALEGNPQIIRRACRSSSGVSHGAGGDWLQVGDQRLAVLSGLVDSELQVDWTGDLGKSPMRARCGAPFRWVVACWVWAGRILAYPTAARPLCLAGIAGSTAPRPKRCPDGWKFPSCRLGGKIGPLISPPFFFSLFKVRGRLPMGVAKDGASVKGRCTGYRRGCQSVSDSAARVPLGSSCVGSTLERRKRTFLLIYN